MEEIKKTCPKCGKEFICNHDPNCWCSTISLSKKASEQLTQEFNNCLCKNCLEAFARENK